MARLSPFPIDCRICLLLRRTGAIHVTTAITAEEFRLFSQLVQSIDRRQRTWLYPERYIPIRAVDNTDSRFDLQPTRSTHPDHPFDSRLLNRGDDGCCSSNLVVIKVRVLPSRIEGADNCFVSSDQ